MRDVQFRSDSEIEKYYAIIQPQFLVALAVTPDGQVLLVKQYRPAIQRFSLELPAGILEEEEDPSQAIAREIQEETGYLCQSIEPLGEGATCSSRIDNRTLSFFVEVGERIPNFVEEPGISVSSVTLSELRGLILSGDFAEQTHLGVITLARCRGLIAF
ncbi:ADP-ribose pyrophosphatase [Bradyrhizobium sp. USDA 4532]|uniref:NUDIX hydrolase n=1 Tax=unclassified Bradyrhizobium TaxID=2631580 RepID=UPI0020A04C63|nr:MULTISPECIES: NUDIX hydrolase [unclassified Bradyrhizobium]MCP1831677.1 ADP-ribose pyrophosphatase [Bradyrhizobium sp. USDA 4545]MCP1916514.1 ADP-ribose pyrophosphatase [Bradyrhizobium sp. USDA 4532]